MSLHLYACPKCAATLKSARDVGGLPVRCLACQAVFTAVPGGPIQSPPAPRPAPPKPAPPRPRKIERPAVEAPTLPPIPRRRRVPGIAVVLIASFLVASAGTIGLVVKLKANSKTEPTPVAQNPPKGGSPKAGPTGGPDHRPDPRRDEVEDTAPRFDEPAAVEDAAADSRPAVVFQMRAVRPMLAELRAALADAGGPDFGRAFDESVRTELDRWKGFDLDRPVVGYLHIDPKAEDVQAAAFVLALPIGTGEEWAQTLSRMSLGTPKPVADDPGLYRVEPAPGPADPNKVEWMRVHDRYAYLVLADSPAAIQPENLVPVEKMRVPSEKGLAALRVRFDRLPPGLQARVSREIDRAVGVVQEAVPKDAGAEGRQVLDLVKQMASRLLGQAKDAREGVVRLVFDAATAELGLECHVTGRPGTELAQTIAARPPAVNRFAGLVGPDTAAGLVLSAPQFAPEMREAIALSVEAAVRQSQPDPADPFTPVQTAIARAMARTVRAGELDMTAVFNGPDRAGHFTFVAGVGCKDSSELEHEARRAWTEHAPAAAAEKLTPNAARVNGVAIHRLALGELIRPADRAEMEAVFGTGFDLAVAFAPHGVYLAVGPDAVSAVKSALAAGPRQARAFDMVLNPARGAKLARAMSGPQKEAEWVKQLGTADRLSSALFVSLEGGSGLRLKVGASLRLAVGGSAWLDQPGGGLPRWGRWQ